MSKFNVGDYVKISKGSSLFNNYLKDLVYQVSEIDYNKIRVNLIVPAGSRNTNVAPWWNEVEFDYFPYVAPKPPRTFKVGDLVTWSTRNDNYDAEDATKIYKVVDINEDQGYRIYVDAFKGLKLSGGPYRYYERFFDLYVEPKLDRKFNIGDLVTWSTENYNYCTEDATIIFKVVDIGESTNGYVIHIDGFPDSFTSGTQSWVETKFDLYVEPRKFKIGDKVNFPGYLEDIYVITENQSDGRVLMDRYTDKFKNGPQSWAENKFELYVEHLPPTEPETTYWNDLPTGTLVQHQYNCKLHTCVVAYGVLVSLNNPNTTWDGRFKVEVLPKDAEFTLKQV